MITLEVNGTTITLPYAMRWVDEFRADTAKQNIQFSLTGVMVVETWTQVNGQEMTLLLEESSQDKAYSREWAIRRSDMQTLMTAINYNMPGVLTLPQGTFDVIFASDPIEYEDVWDYVGNSSLPTYYKLKRLSFRRL